MHKIEQFKNAFKLYLSKKYTKFNEITKAQTKNGSTTTIDDNKPTNIQNKDDRLNILFLFFLYLLQGIPLGLTASLPMILSSRKVSYSDQALFSLATWPFSLKLLWAPIVDSIFVKRIGRRKSWLVPVQYLIGFFMLFFANYVHDIFENDEIEINDGDISLLTAIFFLFTFLAATQDIAVDGWGLTILSKENIGWASICNNAGSTTGVLIGNSLFLILESADFSNLYIRPILGLASQKYGLVSLKEFMEFFGLIFIISTTLILLLKKETHSNYYQVNDNLSIRHTFESLWKIIQLKSIQKLLLILFTCKIAFGTQAIRTLKLIEAGVPKEKLGLINAPFQIIQIFTPILIGKLTDVTRPLDLFLKIYPIRMVITVLLAVWVYFTPMFRNSSNEYPFSYFILYVILNGVYSFIFSTMALTKTGFFTRISDKSIGGTYMTLLNTIANIGNHWPATLCLYLIDIFTFKNCNHNLNIKWNNLTVPKKKDLFIFLKLMKNNTCSSDPEAKFCHKYGGECTVTLDAFYLLTVICTLIGVVWLLWYRKTITNLQSLPKESWKIEKIQAKKELII